MQKDYAKSNNRKNRQLVEQGWRGRLLLVSIIVLVVCLAWYGYDEYQKRADQLDFAVIKSWFVNPTKDQPNPTKSPTVQKNVESKSKQDNEIQFNFYTDLPNDKISIPGKNDKAGPLQPEKVINSNATQRSDVVLSESALSENEETAVTNPVTGKPPISDHAKSAAPNYIVQIAAFRSASAAGDMRISLLLSGFEVNLVKSLDNEHKQIYLLQQGPFSNMSEAKAMQQKLKQRGIESVVKKR